MSATFIVTDRDRPATYEHLYAETFVSFVAHVHRRLNCDPAVAEDIVQLAMLHAWQHWSEIADVPKPVQCAYVSRCVYSALVDEARRLKAPHRRALSLDMSAQSEEPIGAWLIPSRDPYTNPERVAIGREQLRDVFGVLPNRLWRETALLTGLGYSRRDIGHQQGRSSHAVSMNLQRLRRTAHAASE